MVYKLDDADKLCGVTYIDWSKKYSPIPKATCETIKQQCSSGGGGSSDDALDLSCEEIKKLLKGEDKPKDDKPKEDTPNKEETPKENVTPTEEKPQEKPKEDEKPKEEENKPKEEETPRENNTPGENNTPREETPNEEGKEVNLLELMPRIEDELSTITLNGYNIVSIEEPSNEEKEDFERKVIETLKSKLPEGAVVEAVLGEPYYKVGGTYTDGKDNHDLNVRVTLNGKVYEHVYNVPNKFKYVGVTDYI